MADYTLDVFENSVVVNPRWGWREEFTWENLKKIIDVFQLKTIYLKYSNIKFEIKQIEDFEQFIELETLVKGLIRTINEKVEEEVDKKYNFLLKEVKNLKEKLESYEEDY